MRLAVVGDNHLAEAIITCTAPYHEWVEPEDAEVLWWVEDDVPDEIPGTCPVLISSPWPVGTIAALEKQHPDRWFGCSPENVRVAHAVEDFQEQDRIVLGVRHWKDTIRFSPLLRPFTQKILVTTVESAEMIKHALNGLLALEVIFSNEITRICELVDARPDDVMEAVMADKRIGTHGYLKPNGGQPGDHLLRDLTTLRAFGFRL